MTTLPAPPIRCPCLSGNTYIDCCARFHNGTAAAPTAESVMRARYSAFAVMDVAYLLASWHPGTRPRSLQFDPLQKWTRLDINRTERGGPLDTDGIVEFTAWFRRDGRPGTQHETSRFARVDRVWLYRDALVYPHSRD